MDGENLARLERLVERWQATNPDGTPLRMTTVAAGGMLALRTPHCLVDILSEQLLPAPLLDLERLREAHGELPGGERRR